MRKYHSPSLLMCLLLVACTPPAVVKKDVEPNAKKAREDVVALQNKDQVDASDLTKIDDISVPGNASPRTFVEIKGKERKLKLSDTSWEDFPVTVDLNMVSIRSFFDVMHKLTKVNFVLGDEVKGDVTVAMENVGWIELLDIVLKNKNLISEVNPNGQVAVIHTQDFVATQSDSLQKALAAKLNANKAYKNLDSKETAIVRLFYAKPDVLAQQLKDIVNTLDAAPGQAGGQAPTAGNARASFVVDARTNSLIVQTSSTDMEWIKAAISSLDKPTRQVLVEVFIVEATDDFQTQFGSRLGIFNTKHSGFTGNTTVTGTLSGTPPTAAGTINTATVAGSVADNSITGALGGVALSMSHANTDIRMELQAMQAESLIKIVSNPKLFILDNQQATITDGTEVPYATTAQLGATPSIQFKNAALQLQVTPSIVGDGNVYLDLDVTKDTPLTTSSPPPISKKELKTKLLVKDGGVAMIGGINKTENTSNENGVPVLSKIPVLGNLFKSKGDKNNRNQLYIFLAPRVL